MRLDAVLRVILLRIALVLTASGCRRSPAGDDGRIAFEKNSEFSGPRLRVAGNGR